MRAALATRAMVLCWQRLMCGPRAAEPEVGGAAAMSMGTSAAMGDAVGGLQPAGSGRKRAIEETCSRGEQQERREAFSADLELGGAEGNTEGRKRGKRSKKMPYSMRQAAAQRRAHWAKLLNDGGARFARDGASDAG